MQLVEGPDELTTGNAVSTQIVETQTQQMWGIVKQISI